MELDTELQCLSNGEDLQSEGTDLSHSEEEGSVLLRVLRNGQRGEAKGDGIIWVEVKEYMEVDLAGVEDEDGLAEPKGEKK